MTPITDQEARKLAERWLETHSFEGIELAHKVLELLDRSESLSATIKELRKKADITTEAEKKAREFAESARRSDFNYRADFITACEIIRALLAERGKI